MIQRIHKQLRTCLHMKKCTVLCMCLGLESHTLQKKAKSKDKEQPQDEEQDNISMHPPYFATPDGDHMLKRMTLPGQCHIHITALYWEPPNIQLTDFEIQGVTRTQGYDVKVTFRTWGQTKDVRKNKDTQGYHNLSHMAHHLVYPLKESSVQLNRIAAHHFGSPLHPNNYKPVIWDPRVPPNSQGTESACPTSPDHNRE